MKDVRDEIRLLLEAIKDEERLELTCGTRGVDFWVYPETYRMLKDFLEKVLRFHEDRINPSSELADDRDCPYDIDY